MVSILRSFRALVIAEVGGAAAFAADHAGTDGVFRRAHLAEQRALVRRHAGAQHIAATASLRLDGGLDAGAEAPHGVELGVFGANAVAAAGNLPHAAPSCRQGLILQWW